MDAAYKRHIIATAVNLVLWHLFPQPEHLMPAHYAN